MGGKSQSVVGDDHTINNPYRGINTNRAFTMARVKTCLGPDNASGASLLASWLER
jgi:hypothetical protein